MQSQDLNDPRKQFPLPEEKVLDLDPSEALFHLENGDVIGGHTMPWGSNYTFLLWIKAGENQCVRAIYKPRDGEKPLRDFPSGTLYKREQAAYEISKLLKFKFSRKSVVFVLFICLKIMCSSMLPLKGIFWLILNISLGNICHTIITH